jgi:hypothetical protein
MKTFTFILLLISFQAFADKPKANIRYEYKKFEKFDFDEIGVEGDAGAPGDISISPRLKKEFKNKIPERKNFNKEMRKAISGIR